jgi:hypothetical protein
VAIHLDKDELKDAYNEAQTSARSHQTHFDEYERLANNQLIANLPANLPRVNDGSLAALLLETPMRVLAQPITGLVRSVDRDELWVGELANILWTRFIIPRANTQADFFAKLQIDLYKALIYGSQPKFTFFRDQGDYQTADFTLPYVKDVYLEPGKHSDIDSDYIFMNSYYTKLQLKNIIKQAEDEKRSAKEEGRPAESKWDIPTLKKVFDAGPAGKDTESMTPAERKNGNADARFFKFTTVFHRGYDAPFYTFAPLHESKVVRTSANTNPTGDTPIIFTYANQDLSNPYGKGQVEVSGGTQNVLDQLTQLHVLGTQIGLQPPVKVGGPRDGLNLNTFRYAPRALWYTGNATVEPVETSSRIYSEFGSTYGLYKTQLMNLQGTTDATVSGESGNPQYSKTDAGVNMQKERTSAHDNFLLQRAHESYERLAKSMINTHIANMHGSEVVRLLDDEIERMAKTGIEMPETGELEIIWENVKGTFEFEVDSDSNKDAENNAEKEKLIEAVTIAAQDPTLDQALMATGKRLDRGELWTRVFNKLGLEDIDKIIVQVSPEEQAANEQQQMLMAQRGVPGEEPVDPSMSAEAPQKGLEQPAEAMPEELPPEMGEELPVEEEDPDVTELQMELAQTMEQYQVDQRKAALIMQARRQGADEETIAQYLQQEGGVANE